MAAKAVSKLKGLKLFPAPPKGFDALGASPKELARYGLPQRPDPRMQPALAAMWEKAARRYRDFEHLEPKLLLADKPKKPAAAGFGLSPLESCGFELFNASSPITQFSGMWTIPNLNNTPNQGLPDNFRTFFGLGFLDAHVEMTVDVNQNVTAVIRIQGNTQVNLPVHPGDAIRCTLCLQTNSEGTAFFGFVNETTAQTMNFNFDTGFPPAVAINAGISRGSQFNGPLDPLARFGVVYFDDLAAFSAAGARLLTDGVATTMVDSNGSTLAIPQRINDSAFKVIFNGA